MVGETIGFHREMIRRESSRALVLNLSGTDAVFGALLGKIVA